MPGYRDPSSPPWTLAEVEGEIRRLAKLVGAVEDDLPTFDRQDYDCARPNIEPAPWSPAGFAYVVIERGQVRETIARVGRSVSRADRGDLARTPFQ